MSDFSRRITRLGLALLAPLTVLAPAPARASVTTLTLSGSATASVLWTVSTPVVLDLPRVTASGPGEWTGMAVESVDRHAVTHFAVYVPVLDVQTEWVGGILPPGLRSGPVVSSSVPVTLSAGTYRLHLVAQLGGTVTVPLSGTATSVSLTATDPSTAVAELADLRAVPPLGVTAGVRRWFDFTEGALAADIVQEVIDVTDVATYKDICYVQAVTVGTCHVDGYWGSVGAFAHPSPGTGYMRHGLYLRSSIADPGRYGVLVNYVAAVVPRRLDEFFLLVTPT